MILKVSILLLMYLKSSLSVEINVENATEFWSDIISFAESEGISL